MQDTVPLELNGHGEIVTPKTFHYTSKKDEWPGAIFAPLLMRHGPPPRGVKFYGKGDTMHIRTPEAQRYITRLIQDIQRCIWDDSSVSHFAENWKMTHARHIKNRYLRWIYDR